MTSNKVIVHIAILYNARTNKILSYAVNKKISSYDKVIEKRVTIHAEQELLIKLKHQMKLPKNELRGKIILFSLLDKVVMYIFFYMKNFQIERRNKILKDIKFSSTITSELTALFSGTKKSGQNILDPIIQNILSKNPSLFTNKTTLKAERLKYIQIMIHL